MGFRTFIWFADSTLSHVADSVCYGYSLDTVSNELSIIL